jgi:hypothetical protein
MDGLSIRKFFRDLLGSRLVERLEADLATQRVDFEYRLQDKDAVIADLRMEKQQLLSKVALYELTIMPRASVQGAEVVGYQRPTKPNFNKEMFSSPPPMSSWQKVQFEHDEQMKKELEEEAAQKAVSAT